MDLPSRLTVADVDGSTVMVQIWAGLDAGLAEWRPIAEEFVNSIHFLSREELMRTVAPEPSPSS